MDGDITNVKLGVCRIEFNGVDLGHTQGGAEVTYQPEWHDTQVDKYGTTVAEKYLIGEKIIIKMNLAESTLANLNVAIPAGTVSGDKMTIGRAAGQRASDLASTLVLHPIENDNSNRDEDVVLYKAISVGETMLPYKNDGERVFSVEMHGLIDESKTDGNYLGLFGDSAS